MLELFLTVKEYSFIWGGIKVCYFVTLFMVKSHCCVVHINNIYIF
jgi:hypothetical protein